MIKVKRIGIGSAFKVGGVVSAVQFAIGGLFFLPIQWLVFSNLVRGLSSTARPPQGLDALAGIGFGTVLIFYGMGIVFSAIWGGGTIAFAALSYNVAARIMGGVHLYIEVYDIPQSNEAAGQEVYEEE